MTYTHTLTEFADAARKIAETLPNDKTSQLASIVAALCERIDSEMSHLADSIPAESD